MAERQKSRHGPFRSDNSNERAGRQSGHRSGLPALPPEQVVFGMHAAEAALSNPKRTIRHAYLTENANARLASLVSARGVPVTSAHPADLDGLLGGSAVHQGAVLRVEPLQQPNLDNFLDALSPDEPALLAMLDQVTDPQNVGAVLRSAAAFGIAALIVQDRHSPPLTGTLAKTASGALEHVPVIATVNLARALDRLKDHNFRCIGFDSGAEKSFENGFAVGGRTVFVFGAEDKGIRRLIREGCDALYALATGGPIKSLNISNAAAIVFHQAAKSRG